MQKLAVLAEKTSLIFFICSALDKRHSGPESLKTSKNSESIYFSSELGLRDVNFTKMWQKYFLNVLIFSLKFCLVDKQIQVFCSLPPDCAGQNSFRNW